MNDWTFGILYFGAIIGVPVLVVSGWMRWSRNLQTRSFSFTSSLIAFGFSTASAGLAVLTWLIAMVKGFAYYDPLLLTVYAIGLLLSATGVLFGVLGIWRPNPLRWHAPLCSLGMLIFWSISASME
jgi:hypothetical protein